MSLVPRVGRCVLVVFGVLSLTVSAFARETKPKDREPNPASQTAVLKERDRERMHPGDPLAIVGNEQQGNDIRSRTPALARSDRFNACVDAEENYHRTLAMYESSASFPTALPVGPEVEARKHALRPGRGGAPGPGRQPTEIETRSAWPWVVGVGVAFVIGMWALGGPSKPRVRSTDELPAT